MKSSAAVPPNLDSAKCLSKNNCVTPRGRKDRFIGASTTGESRNLGLESSGKGAKTSINMQGSLKVG